MAGTGEHNDTVVEMVQVECEKCGHRIPVEKID